MESKSHPKRYTPKIAAWMLIGYGMGIIIFVIQSIYFITFGDIGLGSFFLPWYVGFLIFILILAYQFIKAGRLLFLNNLIGVRIGALALIVAFLIGVYLLYGLSYSLGKGGFKSIIVLVVWLIYNILSMIFVGRSGKIIDQLHRKG